MIKPIPIFILFRDKVSMLKKQLESFKKIGDKYEVVLIDFDSDYPEAVSYTRELEHNGMICYTFKKNPKDMEELSHLVRIVIDRAYNEYDFDEYYVVTDCDVELCIEEKSNILLQYKTFLNQNLDVECIGTMLELDDLPNYSWLDFQKKTQKEQFWSGVICKSGEMLFTRAWIDTTFAMYRYGFRFHNLNKGYRTFYPYSARHLDWYVDLANPPKDYLFYVKNSNRNATFARELEKNGLLQIYE